ncbi:MAG: exopolysaccharide biosynthesis protein [Phenylobacterium sp.]
MPRQLHAPDEHKTLTDLLGEILARQEERIDVDEVVDHFGRRAFGALLFIFGLLNLLPLPPGGTTVLGLPLLIIAPQLAAGVPNLWLPRAIGRRRLDRKALAAAFDRIMPRLQRLERLLTPRHDWLFGAVGDRIIGAVCAALALVLVLPIPLGNILPALTISTLALGLTQRDGLVVLIGYGLACASALVLALSFGAVLAAISRLEHVFGV